MAYLLDTTKFKLPKKVLIANQGEIALRIIRACHELSIETVAIYSTADANALHVQLADEAICIGPGPLLKSYMHIPSVIQAALSTKADAIHPGYGMLSENFEFAKIVEESGMTWIGPKWETIKILGNKINAREMAQKANVPMTQGSPKLKSAKDAAKWAEKVGYPVMVKAANGGGGRGIEVCFKAKDIKATFEKVLDTAKTLYKDDNVYLEKFIKNPRHVEVQIVGDKFGNIRHFYDRDCSLQRNNQKLIEEAPSAFITPETREKITTAAVRLAKICNYQSAGTVEFLVDSDQNFYFMEMNTRIQVEHPVTEEITGVDIVKEQLKVSGGNKLILDQKNIAIKGHSIEIRINSEDPENNFLPQAGKIDFLHAPNGKGVRFESALYNGYQMSTFADSMIAKVITTSKTREGAILKMQRALQELVINGVKTNIHFQQHLLLSNEFIKLKHTTKFVEDKFMKSYLKKHK